MKRIAAYALLVGVAAPAAANNVGENQAWQFQTSADKVNQAAIADMIEKKGRLLSISHRTIDIHRANVMSKRNVHTVAEVVRIGIYAGVDELNIRNIQHGLRHVQNKQNIAMISQVFRSLN